MALSIVRLSVPPADDLKRDIIAKFWRKAEGDIRLEDYASYFEYYDYTCRALYLGVRCEAKALIDESHAHVLKIVDCFWSLIFSGEPCTRVSIRRSLKRQLSGLQENNSDEGTLTKLNNSINLALRLWLMLDIREADYAPASSTIQWDDHSTLQDFIKRQFPRPVVYDSSSEIDRFLLLESDFTAVNLRKIGAITIDWTWNLADHLKLDRRTRRLKVYAFGVWLYDQKISQSSIIPTTLINEVLVTLHLLFPIWDPSTFRMHPQLQHHMFPEDKVDSDHRYLSDFYHFRDRLAEIHWAFTSPPSSWRQIWTDRRNRLQWYTFWLAFAIFVLTLVFGFIASLTACLQTRYAYQALLLAQSSEQAGISSPG